METVATYKHDVYWRATTTYACALIVYAIIRGWSEGMANGRLAIVLMDPLLILLFAFVVGSAFTLAVRLFMRRSVTVSDAGITVRDRFRSRFYSLHDITRIEFGKERAVHVRGVMPAVKIRLRSRRRFLRIRPSTFTHEHALREALHSLQKAVNVPGKVHS